MVQYHGWLEIRETTGETDFSRLMDVVQLIQDRLDTLADHHRILGMRVQN
jgi:hypothetical protein